MRVYLQLRKWFGNNNVTQWGWILVDNMLVPIYSEELLAPEEIIKKYVAVQVVAQLQLLPTSK